MDLFEYGAKYSKNNQDKLFVIFDFIFYSMWI